MCPAPSNIDSASLAEADEAQAAYARAGIRNCQRDLQVLRDAGFDLQEN